MSLLVRALDAIASGIAAVVPTLRDCSVYHGALDAAEMCREFRRGPAVLVVLAGMDVAERYSGVPTLNARLAAYIWVEGGAPASRSREAIAITERIATEVATSDWGGVAMRQATDIAAVSLYSGEHDRRAVTLWEVSWRQAFLDETPVSPSELHRFRTITASFAPPAGEGSATTDTACSACGEAGASNEEEQNHE